MKVALSMVSIVLAGAFFTALVRTSNSTENEHTPAAIEGTAIKNSAAATANWKTCVDNELGYSVLHPADWHTYGEHSYSESTLFQDSECTGKRVLISQYSAEELTNGSQADFIIRYQTALDLGIARYQGVNSLEEYLVRNPDLADNISRYESTALDGKEFIWLQSYPQPPILITFDKGSLITINGSASGSESTFRAMLSTMRFSR